VYGDIVAGELPISFIPFDNDILSLEMGSAFRVTFSPFRHQQHCLLNFDLLWLRPMQQKVCMWHREQGCSSAKLPCLEYLSFYLHSCLAITVD